MAHLLGLRVKGLTVASCETKGQALIGIDDATTTHLHTTERGLWTVALVAGGGAAAEVLTLRASEVDAENASIPPSLSDLDKIDFALGGLGLVEAPFKELPVALAIHYLERELSTLQRIASLLRVRRRLDEEDLAKLMEGLSPLPEGEWQTILSLPPLWLATCAASAPVP